MSTARTLKLAWACTLGGALLAAAALARQPQDFAPAWLAALTVLLGWPLGGMALVLVHALTGGRWGELLRPVLLAALATLPLVALAALPYAFEAAALYPWLQARQPALPSAFYLNGPFFAGRGVLYLVAWFALAAAILRALRQQLPQAALTRIAPAGLIVLGLTVSFAAIDMTMSLDPRFASSIYGLIAMVSMALTALAAGVLVVAATSRLEAAVVSVLGRLLQGLVLLWGYLDFMQLLILWQSNLLREAHWYLQRSQGFWGDLAMVVSGCHLLLPVAILLWTPARRSLTCIRIAASSLLAAEVLRAWWLVLPPFHAHPHLADVGLMLALLGLAGVVTGYAAKQSARLAPPGRPLARE